MAASCATLPTLTATGFVTLDVIATSTSTQITTAPDTTSTITSQSCVASGLPASSIGPLTCISSTQLTLLTTIPGAVQTNQVTFQVTEASTRTTTSTLFSTSCTRSSVSISSSQEASSTSSTSSTTNPSSASSTTTQSPPHGFVVTSVGVVTTPLSIILSEESTTLANGQISVASRTSTSFGPASTVYIPTTVPEVQGNDHPTTNVAPIVGGVVGGFFGLLGFVLLIWWFIRKRRTWDDIFDKDDDGARKHRYGAVNRPRFDLDDDAHSIVEPKPAPYQYGLVGLASSSPVAEGQIMSEPNAPARKSSPLPPSLAYSDNISRPSTAGSSQPLQSRIPSLQELGANHAHDLSYTHSQSASLSGPPMTHATSFPDMAAVGWTTSRDSAGSIDSLSEGQTRRLQIINRGDTDSVYSVKVDTPSIPTHTTFRPNSEGTGLERVEEGITKNTSYPPTYTS